MNECTKSTGANLSISVLPDKSYFSASQLDSWRLVYNLSFWIGNWINFRQFKEKWQEDVLWMRQFYSCTWHCSMIKSRRRSLTFGLWFCPGFAQIQRRSSLLFPCSWATRINSWNSSFNNTISKCLLRGREDVDVDVLHPPSQILNFVSLICSHSHCPH